MKRRKYTINEQRRAKMRHWAYTSPLSNKPRIKGTLSLRF